MRWFAINILNIIPVTRKGGETNPLALCEQALRMNKILILFPEGTRGEPGILSPLKSGIWHLSQRVPEASIVPVWLCGTERIMAKGNRIPLPLFIDVTIGDALHSHPEKSHLWMISGIACWSFNNRHREIVLMHHTRTPDERYF